MLLKTHRPSSARLYPEVGMLGALAKSPYALVDWLDIFFPVESRKPCQNKRFIGVQKFKAFHIDSDQA
jgi:hypothetical protein